MTLDEEALNILTLISNENRFYTEQVFEESPYYLYDYSKSTEVELSEETLELLRISNDTSVPKLTMENMIEDVEFLHLTLKYMYALYEYMGGDQAFVDAKNDLIEFLLQIDDDTNLTPNQFSDLLREYYDFVEDLHFYINHSPTVENEHTFYFSESVHFLQDASGDYYLVDHEQTKLMTINGDNDLESYLKYSLTDDGEIVLIPGMFTTYIKPEEREWTFTFEENSKLKTKVITLEPMPNELPRNQIGESFAVTEKARVPWLQWRSMFAFEGATYDYYDLISTANHFKEMPYFVLDLRGNEGGSMILVEKWLEAFFDQPLSWSSQSIHLFSDTSKAFIDDTINLYQSTGISKQTFEDDFTDLFRVKTWEESVIPKWEIEEEVKQTVENNSTHIFILVDHHTASAAEHLVSKLKLANNTTVLGVNTRGAIISANSLMWKLPHTQVEMFTPTFFNYNPDLLNKEAIGIQPDLWVTSTRVENRIIAFIQQHTDQE
ncbi:peptidase S41 [Halalkalibacter akibai JCM 9157]|uniref:Peptidase S41 n=2 Tax=Halalkalibacter akibai TaxID=1411 RepID=W4QRN7_HALA3|nr:peptidase S41 [Halalkalibacter akibai JCM 9157]